jgi:hypothetical protein
MRGVEGLPETDIQVFSRERKGVLEFFVIADVNPQLEIPRGKECDVYPIGKFLAFYSRTSRGSGLREAFAVPVEMGFARSGPEGIRFELRAQQGFAGGELFVPGDRRKKCALESFALADGGGTRNRASCGVSRVLNFGVLRAPEQELKKQAPRD